MPSRTTFATLAAAGALAALAVIAGPAAADSPPPATTFHYTGAPQKVTVPAGVTAVGITMTGSSGGAGENLRDTVQGGNAAKVTGFARVDPEDTLTVDVGGAGQDATVALPGRGGWGYTGGGAGGTPGTAKELPSLGGGGGGSSAVLLGDQPLAVAGGGGGGGGLGQYSGWDGGRGGNAGAEPQDGRSSAIPGAGGAGGSVFGGDGLPAATCATGTGGGGGGGGGGAVSPGGGFPGQCGAFSSTHNGGGGGGGGGAGASSAPLLRDALVSTAPTRGNGLVTLTWYTSAGCHDATLVVDAAAASQAVDLSKLCAGPQSVREYALSDQAGVGRLAGLDPATGASTFTTSSEGIAKATVHVTTVLGETQDVTLTLLVARRGTFGLVSGGMALDGGNGDLDNPPVAETPAGSPGQRWTAFDDGAGDGAVVLANAAQGNCVDPVDFAETPGTSFELGYCTPSVSTPIRATATADARSLRLTDAISGLPLELESTSPGAHLVLGRSDESPTWTLAA